MRVAVCLSGQSRFGVSNYQHIYNNLVAPSGADVFCHFWSTEDPDLDMDPYATVRIYQATGSIIDPPNAFPYAEALYAKAFDELSQWKVRRMYSMYLSMHKSLDMPNPYKYDVIIKARTDLLLQQPVTKELLADTAYQLCFYDDRVVEDGKLRLYGDEIFWGPPSLMAGLSKSLVDFVAELRFDQDTARPEKILDEVIKATLPKNAGLKTSGIKQPDIMRNDVRHMERLKALQTGRAPVNDE